MRHAVAQGLVSEELNQEEQLKRTERVIDTLLQQFYRN